MRDKKINLIIKNLKENPEGVTLDFKGAVVERRRGFYVSISNISGRRLSLLISKTLMIKQTAFKDTKNLYLGGWNDGNKYFLDLTFFIKGQRKAEELGRLFNQEAIYNINKKECVFL